MKRSLLCPRTELCFAYRVYVDHTKDDVLGVVKVTTIDNRDYYSCAALRGALEMVKAGQVEPDTARRFDGGPGCLLIDQANRKVGKRRHDA